MRRHKVRAGFSIFVLFFLLFIVEGWVQTQISIHFERERFEATSQEIADVVSALTTQDRKIESKNYCFYESSTSVFMNGDRFCNMRFTVIQQNIEREQATAEDQAVRQVIGKAHKITNSTTTGLYTVATGDFTLHKIECSISTKFYDKNVPESQRIALSPKTGSVALVDVICSSQAQAEYFPVQQS